MKKPLLLKTSLNLEASQSMIFTDEKKIINDCRAYDSTIDVIRNKFQTIAINQVDDIKIQTSIDELCIVNNELNDLKKLFRELFAKSVLNQRLLGWLHIEYALTDGRNSQKTIKISEGRLRWRLGLPSEKRFYCDKALLNSPNFYEFFKQESVLNKKIILEYERVRMLLLTLTRQMRYRSIEYLDLYQNAQSIKELQTEYHLNINQPTH